MRPPEAAPNWTRDVVRSVGLGVMQAMAGGPGGRRARAVEHREENQHSARPRIQRDRAMRDCALIADGGAESSDEDQRDRPCQHLPFWNWVEDQADNCGYMNQ